MSIIYMCMQVCKVCYLKRLTNWHLTVFLAKHSEGNPRNEPTQQSEALFPHLQAPATPASPCSFQNTRLWIEPASGT